MMDEKIHELVTLLTWFGLGAAWMICIGTLIVGRLYRKMLQKKPLLEGLPEMHNARPCRKCAALEYSVWHQAPGVHWLTPDPVECNRCPDTKLDGPGCPGVQTAQIAHESREGIV